MKLNTKYRYKYIGGQFFFPVLYSTAALKLKIENWKSQIQEHLERIPGMMSSILWSYDHKLKHITD